MVISSLHSLHVSTVSKRTSVYRSLVTDCLLLKKSLKPRIFLDCFFEDEGMDKFIWFQQIVRNTMNSKETKFSSRLARNCERKERTPKSD